VVPYPFVCLPGSQVCLNLFEPRWLTLFAKLMTDKDTKAGKALSLAAAAEAASSAAGAAPVPLPLVLEGATGRTVQVDPGVIPG